MTRALFAALLAAVSSGAAAVLQAKGVGHAPAELNRVRDLVGQLARSGWYLAGLALVAVGFLLALVALRELPVFVVAAVRASSLGITALLAWPVLGLGPRRHEVTALLAVSIGLVALVTSAEVGPGSDVGAGVRLVLVTVLVVLAVSAHVISQRPWRRAGAALAAIAGLDFAVVAVAARALAPHDLPELVRDPIVGLVPLAAAHGLYVYARALQRLAVTHVTAVTVAVETIVGSLAGTAMLSDAVRPGWTIVAAAGFLLTLGGCLVLAESGSSSGAVRRRS